MSAAALVSIMSLAFSPVSMHGHGHVNGAARFTVSTSSSRSAVPSMEAVGVRHFVSDLEFLGPCRFVVQGSGAILEAVGAFESMREDESKGIITVSNDDNSFECHLRIGEVRSAAFAKKEAGPRGTLHIIRLLGEGEKPLLSAILHPETPGGEVEEDAITFWESLRKKFGDKVELSA